MADLPAMYIDNVRVVKNDTSTFRGNKAVDCYGARVIGAHIKNAKTVRAKNNKMLRLRSSTGTSKGYVFNNCDDLSAVYNVASRCDIGYRFINIAVLNVYNLTAHNCAIHVQINTGAESIFRNVCLSNYTDHKSYNSATGFEVSAGSPVNLDYVCYYGLQNLSTGPVTGPSTEYNQKPLYIDEADDDLTPDHISILVQTGIDNPLRIQNPDIGGIQSDITDEQTSNRNYHYELLDNTFWDITNEDAAETNFIKALQSRVFASSELELTKAKKDYYIKQMISADGFAELWPMYARYADKSKFIKRVGDLWYATQNPGTLQSIQNAIGGYNLFPTFFKRLEDWDQAWVIGQSAVSYDNVLLGYEGLKYGIMLDVLGTSTLSRSASAECYRNVTKSVQDVAPTHWFLHDEVQPSGYLMFTDLWNNFENCDLENMIYNDDFAIQPYVAQTQSTATTPLILTGADPASGAVPTVGPAASGGGLVEVSLLDRVYSERLDRKLYYRQGTDLDSMSRWRRITNHIIGVINLTRRYVQFKIAVQDILRTGDYEFIGLCMRPYSTSRDFSLPQFDPNAESLYLELEPGSTTGNATNPPSQDPGFLEFANDGVLRTAGWQIQVPEQYINRSTKVVRLCFSGQNLALSGNAKIRVRYASVDSNGQGLLTTMQTQWLDVTLVSGQGTFVNVDVADVFESDTKILYFELGRDSSVGGDTVAGNVLFLNGRTL